MIAPEMHTGLCLEGNANICLRTPIMLFVTHNLMYNAIRSRICRRVEGQCAYTTSGFFFDNRFRFFFCSDAPLELELGWPVGM